MKLKAFEFEANSHGFEEITIDLSMADNISEIKTFTKSEIAEHLGYDVRKNGVHFTADDFNPHRGYFERDFFAQWEDFELQDNEIKQFLEDKDLLYTEEENQEILCLETALQMEYDRCNNCFDLISAGRIKSIAKKLNLTVE
jgi:hypothetical protein